MNCETDDCVNEDWQGTFVGNLCMSCHQFYTEYLEKDDGYSQAHRNFKKVCKDYLQSCEIYMVLQKYK